MELGYRRCCGIDVHKKSLTACVLPPAGKSGEAKKRVFGTFTRDLKQLRGWLLRCQVTEVAMESTGQYWRPVWNLLEGQVAKVVLLNPYYVKALAGEKTDAKDSAWIATQMEARKLRGSFVPPQAVRELRELTRQRVNLLGEVNRVKNRAEQLCQTGNIKISSVATDLFGVSGRRMLRALVEGKRDAGWMADYARGTLRGKRAELQFALEGTFSEHQRWMLQQHLEHLEGLEGRIQSLEQEIEQRVKPYGEPIRQWMTIPGIDRITAWTLIAELGPDASVFADAKHLASWAGLCPGNHESGGKRLSGRTRKGNRYLRRALCQAAWAASHTKNTYLAAFYRRLRSRRGHQKAILALAHHLLVVAYQLLTQGGEYKEAGGDYYDRQNKPKVLRRMTERLLRLGYYVTLEPIPESLFADPVPGSSNDNPLSGNILSPGEFS
jgi:transposase